MMDMSARLARPARASPPDEPTPITAVWLAPKLNERISIAPDLLVLGPGRPSMIRYALTAIANLLQRSVQTTCRRGRQRTDAQSSGRGSIFDVRCIASICNAPKTSRMRALFELALCGETQ